MSLIASKCRFFRSHVTVSSRSAAGSCWIFWSAMRHACLKAHRRQLLVPSYQCGMSINLKSTRRSCCDRDCLARSSASLASRLSRFGVAVEQSCASLAAPPTTEKEPCSGAGAGRGLSKASEFAGASREARPRDTPLDVESSASTGCTPENKGRTASEGSLADADLALDRLRVILRSVGPGLVDGGSSERGPGGELDDRRSGGGT